MLVDDDTMKPEMEALKEIAKQKHDRRVSEMPQRIEYAKKQFETNNIEYYLKFKTNGHFHAYGNDGLLYQFWAGTGKFISNPKSKKKINYDTRGIHNFIKFLLS